MSDSTDGHDSHWPPFLNLLASDADRAWEGFYIFTMKLIKASPPRQLKKFATQDRDDAIHDLICHFCQDSFRVLRQYRDMGRPFAAWFLHVSNNFLSDRLDSQSAWNKRRVSQKDEEDGDPLDSIPHSGPGPHQSAVENELRTILNRCLSRMSQECQILLKAAILDQLKPLDIVRLLQLPPEMNKKMGDKVRDCRRSLMERMRADGIDGSRLRGRPMPEGAGGGA